MKKNTCLKIKENYPLYKTLIDKDKSLYVNQIILDEGSNKSWRVKEENLEHDSEEEIIFNAAKQKYGDKYGLRLIIKELYEEPVFYFDSDGPSHDNSDGKTKLLNTRVKTPHLNFYDEMGIKKARRNQYIEDNENALQADINLGMHFFCGESNINKNIDIPSILTDVNLLSLYQRPEFDVHKGIDFLNEHGTN